MNTDYRIVVQTGDVKDAGTDADVYITLFGENGNSGERMLDSPGNDFERGSVGTYSISLQRDLGNIKSVRIRHNNKGTKPGWFLDYITVQNESSDKVWRFPCNRWLARDEDDHLIDRVLDRS